MFVLYVLTPVTQCSVYIVCGDIVNSHTTVYLLPAGGKVGKRLGVLVFLLRPVPVTVTVCSVARAYLICMPGKCVRVTTGSWNNGGVISHG